MVLVVPISKTNPPVANGIKLAVNGEATIPAHQIVGGLPTSIFPSLSESVDPDAFLATPNTVPRTAATAESVLMEKSLWESVSVRRCGASIQVSP